MKLLAACVALQIVVAGAAFAQSSGSGAGGTAGSPGAASGGTLGTSAAAPGTNALGTAAPSGGTVGRGRAATGTGNALTDKEDRAVDRKIKSICRGC
jgi:hypothetical protein